MIQLVNLRHEFAELVHAEMRNNPDVWVITGDLGYGMWDKIMSDFPDRFINTGAAEQAMMGLAVGLAQSGKIPLVYSITPFLLYRPFETIRNYIHQEKIPVKLVGSGRNRDYENEGFSHWAEEDTAVMKILSNIHSYWPSDLAELKKVTKKMFQTNQPFYINLTKVTK